MYFVFLALTCLLLCSDLIVKGQDTLSLLRQVQLRMLKTLRKKVLTSFILKGWIKASVLLKFGVGVEIM